MKKITDNQLNGIKAENYVGFLLAGKCLVRPVVSGTDTGIDLYCESITENQPNNHFWVQVKYRRNNDRIKIDNSKVIYWIRQPIPVFIFIVSSFDQTNIDIGVVNLTEQFISDFPKTPKVTGQRTLRAHIKLSSKKAISTFLNTNVPLAISRLRFREGLIAPVKPTIELGYEMKYSSWNSRKFKKVILKSIGRTSSLLLKDILLGGPSESDWVERGHLECILETYSKYGNWDMHYFLAESKYKDRKYLDALDPYRRALHCIESDKRISGLQWQMKADEIRSKIKYIEKSAGS